jgi:hypothetical protein
MTRTMRFCGTARLVESLRSDIRRLWDEWEDRCLNFGIQSGVSPHANAFRISTAAIAKLVSRAARLEMTVYTADGEKSEDRTESNLTAQPRETRGQA